MRYFFSPAEQWLLASLPAREAEVVAALMRELDATLIEVADEVEQPTLFDIAA